MGFLDKAKAAAQEATTKAKEGAQELQTKRELGNAYGELGKVAFDLADSGELSHPQLTEHVTKIRGLRESLADTDGDVVTTATTSETAEPAAPSGPPAMPT
jgi:hypothetical protein